MSQAVTFPLTAPGTRQPPLTPPPVHQPLAAPFPQPRAAPKSQLREPVAAQSPLSATSLRAALQAGNPELISLAHELEKIRGMEGLWSAPDVSLGTGGLTWTLFDRSGKFRSQAERLRAQLLLTNYEGRLNELTAQALNLRNNGVLLRLKIAELRALDSSYREQINYYGSLVQRQVLRPEQITKLRTEQADVRARLQALHNEFNANTGNLAGLMGLESGALDNVTWPALRRPSSRVVQNLRPDVANLLSQQPRTPNRYVPADLANKTTRPTLGQIQRYEVRRAGFDNTISLTAGGFFALGAEPNVADIDLPRTERYLNIIFRAGTAPGGSPKQPEFARLAKAFPEVFTAAGMMPGGNNIAAAGSLTGLFNNPDQDRTRLVSDLMAAARTPEGAKKLAAAIYVPALRNGYALVTSLGAKDLDRVNFPALQARLAKINPGTPEAQALALVLHLEAQRKAAGTEGQGLRFGLGLGDVVSGFATGGVSLLPWVLRTFNANFNILKGRQQQVTEAKAALDSNLAVLAALRVACEGRNQIDRIVQRISGTGSGSTLAESSTKEQAVIEVAKVHYDLRNGVQTRRYYLHGTSNEYGQTPHAAQRGLITAIADWAGFGLKEVIPGRIQLAVLNGEMSNPSSLDRFDRMYDWGNPKNGTGVVFPRAPRL